MVVGVDGAGLAEPLGGEGGDHLVGVHVRRGARPGLEHVDRELVVPLALGDLVGRGRDRLGACVGRRATSRSDGVDLGAAAPLIIARARMRRRSIGQARDREVLHRPLGLGAALGARRARAPRPSSRARCASAVGTAAARPRSCAQPTHGRPGERAGTRSVMERYAASQTWASESVVASCASDDGPEPAAHEVMSFTFGDTTATLRTCTRKR